jgi:hypothetical protein
MSCVSIVSTVPVLDQFSLETALLPPIGDTSKFALIKGVPILDEHVKRTLRNGEVIEEHIDASQLTVICRNTQDRAAKGHLGLLFIGHTDRSRPETEQPPHVGYADNYRMGVIRERDGATRPAILCDFLINSEYGELCKGFPRRSVEIFDKSKPTGYIDAIALLKRAPERDLGLLTYSSKENIDYYECSCGGDGDKGKPMALDSEDIHAIVSGVVTGLGGLIREMLQEVEGGEEPAETPGEAPVSAETSPAPAADLGDNMSKELDDRFEQFRKEIEDRYSKENGKLRDQLAVLVTDNESLKTHNLKMNREARLKELRGEFLFDPAKELDYCMKMSDPEFETHVTRIRENYQRSPIDNDMIPVAEPLSRGVNGRPTQGDDHHLTEEESRGNAVAHYAKEHKITRGDEAVRRYLNDPEARKRFKEIRELAQRASASTSASAKK